MRVTLYEAAREHAAFEEMVMAQRPGHAVTRRRGIKKAIVALGTPVRCDHTPNMG